MKRTILFAMAGGLLVAGCGGGGGNGGAINAPDTFMQITTANATEVASSSYEAALASGDFSDLTGETGLILATPGQSAALKGSLLTANQVGGGTATAQVPIPATTEDCNFDGTVTISGRIDDPITPTLSRGDFIEARFNMCMDTPEDTTNGFLRMDIDAFSGDFTQALFDLTATLTADGLSFTSPGESASIDGDTTVRIDTEQSPYIEASVSGDMMTVGSNASSSTLYDFFSTETFDGTVAPAYYTYTARGTLETTELPGAVRYSTPVTFEGFDDDDYPSSGQLLVEGDNSAVRLTALSNIQVLIEIDADGDGEFEQELERSWAELENL